MFHFFAAAVVLLVSYFLGCINGAVMVSHFVIRDDVRSHGSGNAGLTNFYRTYGAKYALAVIAIDMGKTVVAVLIGGFMLNHLLQDWTLGVLLGGLGCEIGHMFPVFFGFKGGKGILCGSVLVWFLDWRVALIAWGLFFGLWLLTRYVSLGSITAAASIPVSVLFLFRYIWLYFVLCLLISGLAIYCHRGNIQRLLNGTESKFKWHVNPIPEADEAREESEDRK
jgi:glycerol-3-phosphate acyltransferase PlsY